MARLAEIDAVKRSIAPVAVALERAADPGSHDLDAFNATLDALLESRNVSLSQVAAIGTLITTAFKCGLEAR